MTDPAAASVFDGDVAIFGGGPAGVAAALALRRHAPERRVVLFTGSLHRRRQLSEILPPGARPLLEEIGLGGALAATGALPAATPSAAWGRDQLEPGELLPPTGQTGWRVERSRFETALLGAASAAGAIVARECSLVDARPADGRWELSIRTADGGVQIVHAGFAIDATGRPAALARRIGSIRRAGTQLVAASVVYRLSPTHPLRRAPALIESRREGWWYSALQSDGWLVVTCFTDADLAHALRLQDGQGWRSALAQAPHTRALTAHGVADDAPTLRPADTTLLDTVTGPGWLATGDAACTFDPLVSQGILKALRQGTAAGYALVDHLGGDRHALARYDAQLRREYADFLAALAVRYGGERRWPHAAFWQRRHQDLDTTGATPLAARSA